MLTSQKAHFELEPGVAYFNCAYMAPMLRAVRSAAEQALELTSRPWDLVANDFFQPAERARELVGRLIGTSASHIAIVPSVSYGIGVAAANIKLAPGQVILLLDGQFPSNVYPWQAMADRDRAEIHFVPRPVDGDWTRAVLERIDSRIGLAALPNCHWIDGAKLDLIRIGQALRSVDATLVLDLTQSAGVFPFAVDEVKPDFVACAAYKWLLGPYSIGFLYAAEHHHQGVPLEYNWITREGSEDFTNLLDYRDSFQAGARRFDMGERANFILLPMLIAALERILAWTPEAIAATLGARNQRIAEALAHLGISTLPAERRAGHILGLRFEDGVPERLLAELKAKKILVSVRGSSLRIAPHLCVDDADGERLVSSIRALYPS